MDTQHLDESHDESYFASFTDMLVGIIFIFIILLMIVANDFKAAADSVTKLNESRDKVLKEIKKSLDDLGVQVAIDTEQGVLRLPESILFGVNEFELNNIGEENIKKLAGVLAKYLPCISVTSDESKKKSCEALNLASKDGLDAVFIEGHTDSTGSAEHNWLLSAQRAISVFKQITFAEPFLNEGIKNTTGIPVLNVSGYQARRPADPSQPNNHVLNRRIELRFIMRSPTPKDVEKLKNAIGK
ncbi:OmpA family protein [Methylophilus aquaticus]|uniref:OmpA family protein n=1 Tax=Methylophilus aquaticus TaxID=1971610 RepID=A0ABT9JW60_9PROT|nr:OmpA family protein [Methylophilus aquaticus]MDP8568315.1 OmpA family protein [Methylophilus aquaticus]